MTPFQFFAKHDRDKFNVLRRGLQKASRKMPATMTELPITERWTDEDNPPIRAWRSREFLAQLFDQEGFLRLSVCRSAVDHHGNWQDGITWDELQQVKDECGFADAWAVEVFPPADHLINVANMRHLFFVDAPDYGWKRAQPPSAPASADGEAAPVGSYPDASVTCRNESELSTGAVTNPKS